MAGSGSGPPRPAGAGSPGRASRRHALGDRREDADRAPARAVRERVEGLEAEEQRDGPAGDLRSDARAFADGLAGQLEHLAPRVGVVVVLGEREGDRTADRRGEPAHPGHLALRRGEVLAERAGRRELEDAGAELAERGRCRTARPRPRRCRAPARRRSPCARSCARSRRRARRPRSPSRTMTAIAAMSSSVAGSFFAPRSPIT